MAGAIYGQLSPDPGDGAPATLSARRLIGELCRDLALCHPGIAIEADVTDAPLPAERAVALGLIVHELVSNSVRHGFVARAADADPGLVVVRLARRGPRAWRLSVTDNGAGLAPDAADRGFGLTLVRLMVDQLRGSLRTRVGPGTSHTIGFTDAPSGTPRTARPRPAERITGRARRARPSTSPAR